MCAQRGGGGSFGIAFLSTAATREHVLSNSLPVGCIAHLDCFLQVMLTQQFSSSFNTLDSNDTTANDTVASPACSVLFILLVHCHCGNMARAHRS